MQVASTFEALQERYQKWLQAFGSTDHNSIIQQIRRMTWESAVFHMINEGRRHSPKSEDGEIRINTTIHAVINRWFAESQLISARRLTDKTTFGDGSRGVYSLRSLIDDITAHRNQLTRFNLLALKDMPYDYAAIKERHDQYVAEQLQRSIKHFWVPKELQWTHIESSHRIIDQSSGVDPAHRSPDDLPCPEILKGLISKLDALDDAKLLVDKFLAHAAAVENRTRVGAREFQITYGRLNAIRETLSKVAILVDRFFLRGVHDSHMSIPQFDQFRHLDAPFAPREALSDVRAEWERYEQRVEAYGRVEVAWLLEGSTTSEPAGE